MKSLNEWLQDMYNQGRPKVDSREFYRRMAYALTGTRDNAWQVARRGPYVQ